MLIHPTLRMQSWGFVIGSALFALGSAPYLSAVLGVMLANVFFFAGSWFFTAAAFLQLTLSQPATVVDAGRPAIRALWLAAAVQLLGTILFNISTGSALHAHTVKGEMHLVWNPNAEGSIAFLVSSALAVLILFRAGTYLGTEVEGLAERLAQHPRFDRVRHLRSRSIRPARRDLARPQLGQRGHVRRRSVLPPGVCSLPRSQEIGAGAAPGVVIPRCPSRFRRDSVRRAIIEATADVPGKYPFETTNQAAHAA